MSVSDGQAVNAAVTNAAFMSRLVDTSTIGVVDLNNTTDANSGAQVTNVQQAINETFDAVGMTGIGDATRKNYSSNNVVSDGNSHKISIGDLDATFDGATGHDHDGTAGNGPKLLGSNIVHSPVAPVTEVTAEDAINELGGLIAESPTWQKITVSHTSLQAAATTNDIELFSAAAGEVIHGLVIKHTTAFSGGSITAYIVSVGVSGDLEKYALPFDVFQSTGDTVKDVTSVLDLESFSGATSIRIAAESTGDNLDQSAAGSVDIYVLTSVLP